jgi:uncharacterized membrane protein YfcA
VPDLEYLILLAAALAASGLIAGTLAGLFGVGGGIVLVPVLYHAFAAVGVDESVRMHLAVGTSLATIIPTSVRSVMAHEQHGAVHWRLLREFSPATGIGTIGGGILTAFLSNEALIAVFASLALLMSIYLGFGKEEWRLGDRVPGGVVGHAAAFAIGFASALMGIGGGTFAVSAMSVYGVPIHEAVATSAGLGFVISVPGALSYMAAGWGDPDLPPLSLGFVSLIGLALVVPATILAAPWGVALAHRLSRATLRRGFAVFLAATALRMVLEL